MISWSHRLPLFSPQSCGNIVSLPRPSCRGSVVLIFALVWLLRNDIGDEYESLLHKMSQLAPLADIQVGIFLKNDMV